MNTHQRRERLRAILTGDQLVRPASVYDALSARAAEVLGYELMMMAGSTASLAVLGAPDLVVLTLTEFAEQARRVTRAASLPLMVDADHGYGNALNVMRCVQELETAGVSALSIEDTLLPRPFDAPGEVFISIEEGAGKMRAAVAARSDPSLVILARTGAVRLEGLDRMRERVKAYAAEGVDGLFLVGLRTRAELEAIWAVSSLPMVLGGTSAELQDGAYLASRGVRIGGWNHLAMQNATRAMYETLRSQREEAGTGELPPAPGPGELMDILSRKRDYDEAIARYLR
ncbi:MAG: isocitrate lyase/PEP mutase family protein [Chloroflexi bacterium]|nr:isocitrate lyase/PEP mutase family protein [Chloroflexota bacterium]